MPKEPIPVPTLYVTGALDGCALPMLADGQDDLFTGGYARETWEGGHFPQLEQPERTGAAVVAWFAGV